MGKMDQQQDYANILAGTFDLDIPNFKKWNPDTRHRRSWFALSVDWFRDPKVIRLSLSDRALFIQLLATRASSVGHLSGITVSSLRQQQGIRGASVYHSILNMLNLKLIEVRCVALHDIHDMTDTTDMTRQRGAQPPQAPAEVSEPDPIDASLPNLQELWNGNRGSLPECRGMNDQRTKLWRTRYRENPDPVYWADVVKKMARTAFTSGKNERGWKADIQFLLKPTTHLKVMEGAYDQLRGRPMTKEEVVRQANHETAMELGLVEG